MIRDVINREPINGEIVNNESMIVNDGVSGVYEILNIDNTLYKNFYRDETDSGILDTLAGFDVTDDGISSPGGGINYSSSDETLTIPDVGDTRVILGRLSTSNNYGLKMLNSLGTTIFKFDTDAEYAEIAGWKFNSNSLWTSSAGTFPSDPDSVPGIYQGLIFSNTGGIQKMSLFNDNDNYLWWDGSVLRIKSAYFKLDEIGNITATGGTIGGWEIDSTLLRSSPDGTSRIELHKSKNRVSIFSDSTEKIAMGYLEGLLKNNSIGLAITQPVVTIDGNNCTITVPSITSEEHENAFPYPDGLVSLRYWMADTDGLVDDSSQVTMTIIANTYNTLHVRGTGCTALINAGSGFFRLEFVSDDYGFWVLDGDKMRIDGDVTYDSGDWLINSDGALKFVDGNGVEVMRLGTRGNSKGLFLGAGMGDSDITARYTSTGFKIGDVDGYKNFIDFDSTTGLRFAGGITFINGQRFVDNFDQGFDLDTITGGTTSTDEPIEWGWENKIGDGELSISVDSQSGNTALQIGNNADNDQRWLTLKHSISYDPDKIYKVTVVAKQTHPGGTAYFGVAGRNAADDGWINTAGADANSNQHYLAANGVTLTSSYQSFVGYFSGHSSTQATVRNYSSDIATASPLYTGVKFFRPLMIVHHSGTVGITLIDSYTVEETELPLAGTGVNVIPQQYIGFEGSILPTHFANTTEVEGTPNLTITWDSTALIPGNRGNNIVVTNNNGALDGYLLLTSGWSDYNISIEANKKWIFSFYVKSSTHTSKTFQAYCKASDGSYATDAAIPANNHLSGTTSGSSNTVTRFSGVFDLSNNASTLCYVRVDNESDTETCAMHFSGFQLEKQIGTNTEPSPLPWTGETIYNQLTINTDGIHIKDSYGKILADYGTNIVLGASGDYQTTLTPTSLTMNNSSGTVISSLVGTTLTLGDTTVLDGNTYNSHVVIDSNGMIIKRQNGNNYDGGPSDAIKVFEVNSSGETIFRSPRAGSAPYFKLETIDTYNTVLLGLDETDGGGDTQLRIRVNKSTVQGGDDGYDPSIANIQCHDKGSLLCSEAGVAIGGVGATATLYGYKGPQTYMANDGPAGYWKCEGKFDLGPDNTPDGGFQLGTNGYTYLPNGFIMQWGQVSDSGNPAHIDVDFPLEFPSQCRSVQATSLRPTPPGTGPYNIGVQTANFTVTNFRVMAIGSTGGSYLNDGVSWIAIGY